VHDTSQAFLACDTTVIKRAVGLDLPTPFPRLPCQSVCQSFGQQCDAFLHSQPALAALIPNCTTTGLYQPAPKVCGVSQGSGGPDFPSIDTVWATVPAPFTTACNSWVDVNATAQNNGSTVERALTYAIQCPGPLVVPENPDFVNPIGGSCAIPCPVPLYTPEEYLIHQNIMIPMSWISITLGGTLVLLTDVEWRYLL
jgi:hypothetical protein